MSDTDIANANGANGRRLDVVGAFFSSVMRSALDVALFSDERVYDANPLYHQGRSAAWVLDQRDGRGYEQLSAGDDPHLGHLDFVVTKSSVAIPFIRAYIAKPLQDEYLAELFAMRGYAVLQMAEDICSGFPINDVAPDNQAIYSAPFTTDSAVQYAITQLDSALAHGHDSTEFLNLARVAKGRALLDLGAYAQAAAAVSAVPDAFVYQTDPSTTNLFVADPGVWDPGNTYSERYAVGDLEGGNGLPFVTAHDARVSTVGIAVRFINTSDSLFDQRKYTSYDAQMVIAGGVEARLIEAEAALHEPNPNKMIDILNALRRTVGLADVTTPSTTAEQVGLLYRERAFWLYLTGRRLGDLRRLIRNYGRTADNTFPTGAYPLGGAYGAATAIPFVFETERAFNAKLITGCAVE